jgi:S-DNA-T family DNA segregation ATPase FtsK/SpoIIIE
MVRESRWVDPAPLEVSRPRLPWWTMLPGWVKLVLSPVALLVLLSWLGYQLGRVVYRYPLSLALLIAAWWSYSGLGPWWFAALLAVLLGLLVLWWWRARPSFERFAVPRIRTECRRLFVYAWAGVPSCACRS